MSERDAPAEPTKTKKGSSPFRNRTWLYHPRYGGKLFQPGDKHPGKEWTDNYKDLLKK